MADAEARRGGAALDAADLFFCLAAAFLPPPAEMTGRAWCHALAADVDELAELLAVDARETVGALRRFAQTAARPMRSGWSSTAGCSWCRRCRSR